MSALQIEILSARAGSLRNVLAMKMEGTPGYYAAAMNHAQAVREWVAVGGRLRLVKNG